MLARSIEQESKGSRKPKDEGLKLVCEIGIRDSILVIRDLNISDLGFSFRKQCWLREEVMLPLKVEEINFGYRLVDFVENASRGIVEG